MSRKLSRMYGVRLAARLCGLSELTVRRAYSGGALEVTRIGRRVLISENELERFMKHGDRPRVELSAMESR